MLRAVLLLATPIIAPLPLGRLLFPDDEVMDEEVADAEAEEVEGCAAAGDGADDPALAASEFAESPF